MLRTILIDCSQLSKTYYNVLLFRLSCTTHYIGGRSENNTKFDVVHNDLRRKNKLQLHIIL